MDRQLHLLYFSATGTTARVVKAIAEGMNARGKEYDLTVPFYRARDVNYGENDVVIVGSPVYGGRIPDFLAECLARVKGRQTPVVLVVVYGNRDYDDALLELKNILEPNGFIGIAGAAFIGEHSYTNKVATGRPDQADLKIAREFGARIKVKLAGLKDITATPRLIVKGNFPYKDRAAKLWTAPKIDERCTQCGMCAEQCPMQAINWNDFSDIDAGKCIQCCSCVKRCPVGAISLNHERIDKIRQMLITNFGAIRKEPEIFI